MALLGAEKQRLETMIAGVDAAVQDIEIERAAIEQERNALSQPLDELRLQLLQAEADASSRLQELRQRLLQTEADAAVRLQDLRERLQQADVDASGRLHALNEVYASVSWRVTAPLRALHIRELVRSGLRRIVGILRRRPATSAALTELRSRLPRLWWQVAQDSKGLTESVAPLSSMDLLMPPQIQSSTAGGGPGAAGCSLPPGVGPSGTGSGGGRTMKLLIDMFSCQTGSRRRGIGRYSLSLAEEMSRLRGRDDMAILANGLYPESFEELRQQFIRLLPSGSFLPYYHYALAKGPTQHFTTAAKIAETFIEHAYQAVSADFILTPSLFEGWGGVEYGWVPLPSKEYPNQQRAVILYDLIPYVFRQHYLEPDPPLKAWYMERMEILRKFDLLLAISEATRQDAINLLGIEPDRVVNISGAASSHFGRLEFTIADKQDWLHRLGISRPFALYIGGDDFRKNMEGAVRAYRASPARAHLHASTGVERCGRRSHVPQQGAPPGIGR